MPRLTDEQAREILARAEAATLGPWVWRGNMTGKVIELRSLRGGGFRVMTFVRWGLQSAMPTFLDHARGIIDDAKRWFIHPEPHNLWLVSGIDHPDAIFIAAARTDVPSLAADLLESRAALRELVRLYWESAGKPALAGYLFDAVKRADALLAEAEPRAEERADG